MAPMRIAVTSLAAAVLVLTGCGGGSAPATGTEVDAGPAHIHGLGVNPADGSLVIATHSGLFRAGPQERRARRIGDRRQDTMGFTVVGPDAFVGSGHPDPRDDLPPLLGLIRSEDAGRTWQAVSLQGRADFHVLRAAGTRLYGVNAADGLLLVSDDGGRRWAPRTPPGAVLDLAARPGRPDEVLVATDRGLFSSTDAGRRWRPLSAARTGMLAWPDSGRLVLVDGEGVVHRSADAGRSWERAGEVGGVPAALAAHGSDLYVALHSNEVRRSADGGRTWQLRVAA